MALVELYQDSNGDEVLRFYCTGCQKHHYIRVQNKSKHQGPTWEWNGSIKHPTVKPSFREFIPADKQRGRPKAHTLCHLFITKGRIRYLNDCEHAYKGKVVPMEDVKQDGGV